jgi:hypothetical protein
VCVPREKNEFIGLNLCLAISNTPRTPGAPAPANHHFCHQRQDQESLRDEVTPSLVPEDGTWWAENERTDYFVRTELAQPRCSRSGLKLRRSKNAREV